MPSQPHATPPTRETKLTIVRYRILERHVTIKNPNLKVLARVGLDQFVFAPPNIAVFFTAQSLMEGETMEQIKNKLDRN